MTEPDLLKNSQDPEPTDACVDPLQDTEFQYFELVRHLRLHPHTDVERNVLQCLYQRIQHRFQHWGHHVLHILQEVRQDWVLTAPPVAPKHFPRQIYFTLTRDGNDKTQEPALYVALREEGLEVGFGFGLRKWPTSSPLLQKWLTQVQRFHRKAHLYLAALLQRDYRCWPRPFQPFHTPTLPSETWFASGGVMVRLLDRGELHVAGTQLPSWIAQIFGELLGWFGFIDRQHTKLPHIRPLAASSPEDMMPLPSHEEFTDSFTLQSLFLDFQQYARHRQLLFSVDTIRSYVLSLQTRPLVILSGPTGTGKSKLALLLAQYLTQETQTEQGNPHLVFLPVRPDWLDPHPLLGYYDTLAYVYRTTPFLELLVRAYHDPESPYFVILDEMNLARIEYYFADILSLLESRIVDTNGVISQQSLSLHSQQEPLLFQDSYGQWLTLPCQLPIPENVYFTGTVNVDETTHRISPKVLDRANLLEMNHPMPSSFLHQLYFESTTWTYTYRTVVLTRQRAAFCREGAFTTAYRPDQLTLPPEYLADLASALEAFAHILSPLGLSIGPRTLQEMVDFGENLARLDPSQPPDFHWWLDHQLLQKILPGLHGSRQTLLLPLRRLLLLCWPQRNDPKERNRIIHDVPNSDAVEQAMERSQIWPSYFPPEHPLPPPDLPLSAQKITRMLQALQRQTYIDFHLLA